MAGTASSPNISNNGSDSGPGTPVPSPAAGLSTPTSFSGVKSPIPPSGFPPRSDMSGKNLRGLNKPKCINCGNVARSRCPFKCCKSCCFKAQNPCHIHVLKQNSTLADRGGTANAAPPEQQPTTNAANTAPPPGPSAAKVNSIRQLSSTFAQFNNVHIPLRSRKPLSVKEALVINEWRFAKLKEYKESNIEAENEAFDRYMQNISLLEEVLDVNSEMPKQDSPTTSGEKAGMVSEMKARLRSNPVRIDTFRKRIRQTIDLGLKKLQHYNSNDTPTNLDNEDEPTPKAVKIDWWEGKTSALTELNDKLNRVQNDHELNRCIEIRAKIKGQAKLTLQKKIESSEMPKEETIESRKPLLKFVRATEIDQDTLNSMEFYFSSLEEIEDL